MVSGKVMARGYSKLRSAAVCSSTCRSSFAVSELPSVWAATASRPADTSSPMMPELRPVASEEHEVDDTLTEMLPPKLVQPSMNSHDCGSTGSAHAPPGQSAARWQPLPLRDPPAHVFSPKS